MEEEKTTLTKLIDKIHDIIVNTKWENHVFLTGSCLRKAMLGEEITNVELVIDKSDISTSFARWIMQQTKNYKFDVNPSIDYCFSNSFFKFSNDEDLSNITISCKSFRKKLYVNGCLTHDVSNFGSMAEEYKQRDVTIDAFYYDISKKSLIDVEGQSINDIKNKVLRCPSNPSKLLREDPLKILRIIRLSVITGFGIDKDTWLAMIENAKYIIEVPKYQRIKELNKILLSDKPSIILRKMLCCNNILSRVLPGVDELTEYDKSFYPRISMFNYTMKALDYSKPLLENRLAVLLHGIGVLTLETCNSKTFASESSQFAELILKELLYSQDVIDKVSGAILMQKSFSRLKDKELPSNKSLRDFISLCGESTDLTLDTIDALQNALYPSDRSTLVSEIRAKIESMKTNDLKHMHIKLPISGKDIVNEFKIKPGALVGELMTKLRKEYTKRNKQMTRGECLDFVNLALVVTHN